MQEKYLNILYKASLEFGSNWLRPLDELVRAKIHNLSEDEYDNLCKCVDFARDSINEYIEKHFEFEQGLTISDEIAVLWVKQNFSWMSNANISRGISQGLYYAWHG